MFSPTHPMAVSGCTKQRHTHVSPPCVGQAVLCGGWAFFHKSCEVFHNSLFCTSPIGTMNKAPVCKSAQWPDGTVKSMNNVFTEKRKSPFDGDQTERAKATLARKNSYYGQATGAVAHGHEVMGGLSAEAQKRLKAVPYSQPISPSKSSPRGSHRFTVIEGGKSVGAPTYQDKV